MKPLLHNYTHGYTHIIYIYIYILCVFHCKPTQLERSLSACLLTSWVLWTTCTPSGKPPALTMYFISYIKDKMLSNFRRYQYMPIYIWTIILLYFRAWQVTCTAPLCSHTDLEYCFTHLYCFSPNLLLDLPHTWHHTGLMAGLAADLSCSKDWLHATHSLRMLLHHTTPLLEHQPFSAPSRWGLAISYVVLLVGRSGGASQTGTHFWYALIRHVGNMD